MESFQNISSYCVYSTYSHCILVSIPSMDHQKHGPANSLPFWHPKSQKNHKQVPKVTPKMILKSVKIYTWTSKCLLGDPLDPWITKMVSQVPKMEPQGLQNETFWYKKLPISAVNLSAVACWQGGRRQGRRLKIYIYIYIYTYRKIDTIRNARCWQ